MVKHFFIRSRTIRRFHDGPLGECIDRFAERLWERGSGRGTARSRLSLLAQVRHEVG